VGSARARRRWSEGGWAVARRKLKLAMAICAQASAQQDGGATAARGLEDKAAPPSPPRLERGRDGLHSWLHRTRAPSHTASGRDLELAVRGARVRRGDSVPEPVPGSGRRRAQRPAAEKLAGGLCATVGTLFALTMSRSALPNRAGGWIGTRRFDRARRRPECSSALLRDQRSQSQAVRVLDDGLCKTTTQGGEQRRGDMGMRVVRDRGGQRDGS